MNAVFKQSNDGRDFLKPAADFEKLFWEEQLVLYCSRTLAYMRDSFPALSSTLTNRDIERLAIEAMRGAERWGYTSEREIWQYLIVVAYCGFYFDVDPQYAELLQSAGWNRDDMTRHQKMDALLERIESFYAVAEDDFGTFDKKVKYVAQFYLGWNFQQELTKQQRIAIMEKFASDVFPARWAKLSPRLRQMVLATILVDADKLGLDAKNSVIYAIAAIYFGRAFERSPVYPWAHSLADMSKPIAWRTKQFMENVQKHFIKLAGLSA